MPASRSDPRRVRDIEAAIARAKPRDRLKLGELALLWGVTKPRFVSTRNQMPGFPDPVDKDGNEYFYPALKALRVMLAYERRHDAMAKARQHRADLITGEARRRGAAVREDDLGAHTPNELATLSRVAADAEERERQQGLYVPRSDVVSVAGDVFAEVSDLLSRLEMEVDPHGRLPPAVRAEINKSGKERLLRIHRRMRDMLTPDAKPAGTGSATRSAGKPRARRERG